MSMCGSCTLYGTDECSGNQGREDCVYTLHKYIAKLETNTQVTLVTTESNRDVTDTLNDVIDFCKRKLNTHPINSTTKHRKSYEDALRAVISFCHSEKENK